ncbi:EamA family transporter [Endozoicomonas sp. OPT23]|uniref:DMT family transporter n=1 Tax=Endozoicomonas sp. OPT23 TaxID=2072845 RepID=UPI00129BF483|nr:DMT family transporter [Endozoicomonas sp. OPT23]MRI32851.1 EamA family transporter [Endozoicomonas sp. OPT23]
MNQRTFFADGLLVVTALIWGSAFVAQRLGMDHMEPWAFNAVRFLIGSFALIPLLIWQRRSGPIFSGATLMGGIAMGVLLTAGAGLQQLGLVYTTAGKAAFITGLYLVIVPILGLLLRQKTNRDTWAGIMLALPGLALLTLEDDLSINKGDMYEVFGAFFWAAHLILIDRLASRHNVVALAFIQFVASSVLCFIIAGLFETWTFEQIQATAVPLLYVGIMSTGIAYTLQIVGQKSAPVAHASIILSLETVFAVIAGYLFLNEILSAKALAGCGLMLTGMLVSQLGLHRIRRFFFRGQPAAE